MRAQLRGIDFGRAGRKPLMGREQRRSGRLVRSPALVIWHTVSKIRTGRSLLRTERHEREGHDAEARSGGENRRLTDAVSASAVAATGTYVRRQCIVLVSRWLIE